MPWKDGTASITNTGLPIQEPILELAMFDIQYIIRQTTNPRLTWIIERKEPMIVHTHQHLGIESRPVTLQFPMYS